jgi:hypothetical protein
MTAPTAGQTFNTGANLTLSATAAGQSGLNISRVQFTTNGVVVGEDDTAPYSVTWANVPEGVYGIRAIAIDEIGQSTTSDSVAITVGGTTTTGARIAWISFHTADETPSTAAATAGFTNAADVEYTRLLEGAGHAVTRFRTSGTPDTNVLNTFDLVIISRSVPSGDYETAAETAAWNGITAPTMILGGYIIRANRLGLMTGNTIPDTVGPIKLTVTDTNHPIFQDISFDAAGTTVNDYADIVTFTNFAQRGISVVMDPVAGEATVLATVGTAEDATFGGTIIAEWNAGAVTGNARADVLAGERLLFLTGSREHNGLTSEGAGIIDLTEDGRKMFLNAVNYLAGTEPQPERTKLGLTRTAQGQISIQFEGTLQSTTSLSTPNWGTEATVSPHTVAADQPVKFYRAVQN